MIIDAKAGPLLDEYKVALEDEAAAVSALHASLKSGNKNSESLIALTKAMQDAHGRAMSILSRLEQFRLDKG